MKRPEIHSTTILSVRRGSQVVVAGDGQVTLGNQVVKGGARKVRIGRPGHIQLTTDELTLVRMLAAAQAQDSERFMAHACWIMGHNRLDRLYAGAVRFTDMLRDRGHEFQMPEAAVRVA